MAQVTDEQLLKMRNDAIDRHYRKYQCGAIDYNEYKRLCDFEQKNYESGGLLYAERITKALTPSEFWHW